MNGREELMQSAPELTKQLLLSHYERRPDFFYDHLDEDVMWIGPLEHQFVFSKAEVVKILSVEQNVVFRMDDSKFFLVSSNAESCVVGGWIAICTEESSGYVLKCRQRLTFTYRADGDKLMITHMHVSESWDVLDENEIFPFRAAKQTYQYMQQLLEMKLGSSEKIMVYDTRRRAHFIMENEILYVEVRNMRCCLYCLTGKIIIAENIRDFHRRLSKRFVRVHRSYVVNVDYIVGMERFYAKLCDGIEIPVPEKKYVQVREAISRIVMEEKNKGGHGKDGGNTDGGHHGKA